MALEQQETDKEPIEGATTLNIPETESANDNAGDDGGQDAAPAGETPEQRVTRKERKANRFNEARRAQADAEKRLASYEDERRKHAQELAEMRGRLSAYEQRQQMDARRTQVDPAADKVSNAHKRAYEKLKAAAAGGTPEQQERAMQEYHAALTEASEYAADRRMQVQLEAFRRSMPDVQQTGLATTLASEFDWLPTNQAARALADGYVGFLINNKGRQPGLATYREACAMAAKEFGLGGAAERPSEARRAAYAGISGREAAGGDDDDSNRLSVPQSDIPALKKMAHAQYPELDPDAAFGKWLKLNGPKLRNK